MPEPGCLFVPAHLRVLHASSEPLFFKGNLPDNLTFGVAHVDEDARPDRVISVCTKLGFTDSVWSLVRQGSDGAESTWAEVLSHTQQSLCSLARAVISNPEVLCVHKPTMAFNEKDRN